MKGALWSLVVAFLFAETYTRPQNASQGLSFTQVSGNTTEVP